MQGYFRSGEIRDVGIGMHRIVLFYACVPPRIPNSVCQLQEINSIVRFDEVEDKFGGYLKRQKTTWV
jgi:hypothetical protein